MCGRPHEHVSPALSQIDVPNSNSEELLDVVDPVAACASIIKVRLARRPGGLLIHY